MSGTVPFDPQQVIARLVAEEVDFVIIGGVAATLQGAELPTLDLDIVYERSREAEEQARATILFTLEDETVELLPGEEVGYFHVTVEKLAAPRPT
jgi:hypothetical protein